ncbi:MAG: SGNH/GDSL hydrolase family protein [Gemmatimonadaceae bacterium]
MLIFGLAVEFWARVDDYVAYAAPMWSSYNNRGLYTTDSLGQRGKPNASYRKWQLNELGFRGPAFKLGRVNIVSFGASETFGLYESDGKEYPRQLEEMLNRRLGNETVQVVNAAYPGESALTANVRAPEIVEQIHPTLAIVYPTPADYIWLPYLSPSKSGPQPKEKFEWRVAERVRTLIKGVLPQAIQTRLREMEIERSAAEFKVMDTLPEENVQRFHDDVTRLVLTLRSRGVRPVIVTHASALAPTSTADDRQLLVSWRKFYPMLKEAGFLDMEQRMNEALRAIATEQNMTLIDAARAIPPNHVNFADFVHFTDQGATMMASTLADGLLPILRERIANRSRQESDAK